MREWTDEEKELLLRNGRLGVRVAVAQARVEQLMRYATANQVVATPEELEDANPVLQRAAESAEALVLKLQDIINTYRERLAKGEITQIVRETEREVKNVVRPVDLRSN